MKLILILAMALFSSLSFAESFFCVGASTSQDVYLTVSDVEKNPMLNDFKLALHDSKGERPSVEVQIRGPKIENHQGVRTAVDLEGKLDRLSMIFDGDIVYIYYTLPKSVEEKVVLNCFL